MRRIIAGLKVSLDGMLDGPEGMADWVDAWSEEYGLTGSIDACLLGGGMYPGYERYWSGVLAAPEVPAWIRGTPPTEDELAWARSIAGMPHYVLSRSMASAQWPGTRFLRDLGAVAALKRAPGRDIYLMGGARVTSALLDAGLVDEIRLLSYPVIVGEQGRPLFGATTRRRALALREVRDLPDGRVGMTYAVT